LNKKQPEHTIAAMMQILKKRFMYPLKKNTGGVPALPTAGVSIRF
jgi:hypothetical protein